MNTSFKSMLLGAIATAGLALAFGALPASASCSSGFLTNLACETGLMDRGTANGIDATNDALGNPVDHAGTAVLDYYVPGAGAAVEANWRRNRAMAAASSQSYQQRNGYTANQPRQPIYSDPTDEGYDDESEYEDYGQYTIPQQQSYPERGQGQGRLVNYCMTSAGRYGPFQQWAPIGYPCWAMTPWGVLTGVAG